MSTRKPRNNAQRAFKRIWHDSGDEGDNLFDCDGSEFEVDLANKDESYEACDHSFFSKENNVQFSEESSSKEGQDGGNTTQLNTRSRFTSAMP